MRNLLITINLALGVIASSVTLDEAAIVELAEGYLAGDGRWTEPGIDVRTVFDAGGGAYLALITVAEEAPYYSDAFLLYVVTDGTGYKLADVKGGFVSGLLSDKPVTFSSLEGFGRSFYVLEFGEVSYGSGSGFECDYYDVYYIDGGRMRTAFRDATRAVDVLFSRWYGGYDSTGWQDGSYYEEMSEVAFDDLDGDGWPEALVLRKSREDDEAAFAFSGAHLYSVEGTADCWGQASLYGEELLYKEVTDRTFEQALEARGDALAYAVLYEIALWYEGDVPKALEMLARAKVKSLTGDAEVAAGYDAITANISKYKDDPPEAVRLFYAGEFDRVLEEYPGTGVWVETRFRSYAADDALWCMENFPGDRRWPTRVQAYVYAGLIGEEGPDLAVAEKHVNELLKTDCEPEDKAQTCCYLADWFAQEGNLAKAREYYAAAFHADPGGPFGDYAASRVVLYYDPGEGAAVGRLDWMLRTVKWDNYGWWRTDVEAELTGLALVSEAGATVPLSELTLDGEKPYLWLDSGDFDGDGDLELSATATFRDAGLRRLYIFEKRDAGFEQAFADEQPAAGVKTVEEVFAGRPAIIYGAAKPERGVTVVSRRIIAFVDGAYRLIGDIPTGAADTAAGETVWSAELRFEPDEKRPRAFVEVVDYSGLERRVLEVKGVYEYSADERLFVKVNK